MSSEAMLSALPPEVTTADIDMFFVNGEEEKVEVSAALVHGGHAGDGGGPGGDEGDGTTGSGGGGDGSGGDGGGGGGDGSGGGGDGGDSVAVRGKGATALPTLPSIAKVTVSAIEYVTPAAVTKLKLIVSPAPLA